ncbi:MAG: flippase-like domain-containing protein [Rhodospirillales bacterium]|nr:flippase-like domain-containing protein [Rhodospirillales bacterium]
MKVLKILYVLLGLGLLVWVFQEVDLSELWQVVSQVGWGIAVVLGLYFAAFLIDSYTWQLTLVCAPLNLRWLYRTWKVRMVGEVFNTVVPAGGMGGEPVKAVLLKKYYGIGYREGTASLILAKTINMIALVIFLAGGFALMMSSDVLPVWYHAVGGAGLVAFAFAIALFFAIQRYRVSSATGNFLSRWRAARGIAKIIHHIEDMDERLAEFYTRHIGRLVLATTFAWINWMLGVAEVYYAMMFLGHPITWSEAWIIEAAAQLVRTGAFFIPAGIGAQEGAFLLVCSAVTGVPVVGVAVALVRRVRELTWIAWGSLLGAMYSMRSSVDQ